jgi:hypothetical protein
LSGCFERRCASHLEAALLHKYAKYSVNIDLKANDEKIVKGCAEDKRMLRRGPLNFL